MRFHRIDTFSTLTTITTLFLSISNANFMKRGRYSVCMLHKNINKKQLSSILDNV